MLTDQQIAYQCAPVILQKVNRDNPRGDFITRIDFTDPGDLTSLTRNWSAVNDPVKNAQVWEAIRKTEQPKFTYNLLPHVYYSVVETHSHYFVLYAVYHPQDWEAPDTPWRHEGPKWTAFDSEHEHDMEGALIIAGKREKLEDLRADAMITISHWWFYSYANWQLRNSQNQEIPVFPGPAANRYRGSRVNKENLDGHLWAIWHTDELGTEILRPKLYVEGKGHDMKGDKTGWGGGDRIIRYCPSILQADEPSFFETDSENPAVKLRHKDTFDDPGGKPEKDVCRYELIDIFEPNTHEFEARGLWASRDNPKVFLVDDRGQDCFVTQRTQDGKLESGSAKPPWSWDDRDDAHTTGELALQPAHITYNYLGGIREFSLEYVRNRYLGI